MEIHVPNTKANNENSTSNEFFHSRHLKVPKWFSQHETVSTTAGILMPRTEKNIAPTREINGSNSGTSNATTTTKIQRQSLLSSKWYSCYKRFYVHVRVETERLLTSLTIFTAAYIAISN